MRGSSVRRFTAVLAIVTCMLLAQTLARAEVFTLKASGAQTGPAQGSLVDIGSWRTLTVLVNVTAGSGTVNPFRVWLEGTVDGGTNWYELSCTLTLKAGATAPGTPATARDIVNEVALVTAAKYSAVCETYASNIRAAWNIAGTTPSETFAVSAVAK